jgi:anti-sigma B factor antagonist
MSSPVHAVIHGDRVVLHVAGEVDIFTASTLRGELGTLIEQRHTDLFVDLTGVTFIDSTGLGVLVGALRSVRSHGGRMHLVTDDHRLLKALRITALSTLFTVHPDLWTALSDPTTPAPAGVDVAGASDLPSWRDALREP